jgi:hypothetical protein
MAEGEELVIPLGDLPSPVRLPPSAADARPGRSAEVSAEAYIVNPIFGRERLTPLDALRAIGILSATLESDEHYRGVLYNRKAPE